MEAAAADVAKPISIARMTSKAPVDFQKDVLPILKNNCLACHNRTTSKADLVLESPETIIKGGENGPAVIPGKSAQSLLLKVASHQEKPRMPPRENKVNARDLSPDELGRIQAWIDQGAKGSIVAAAPLAWQPLPAGMTPIYAVALTRDGQFAACARGNQIFLYHLPAREKPMLLIDTALMAEKKNGPGPESAHRDLVHSLAFNPDGNLLASGGFREVKLWQRATQLPIVRLKAGVDGTVTSMALSHDGQWLATGCDTGLVEIWNLRTGARKANWTAGAGPMRSLEFSPDDTRLLSVSRQTLRATGVASGKPMAETNFTGAGTSAVWLGGGSRVGVGRADGSIALWELKEGGVSSWVFQREVAAHGGAVVSMGPAEKTNEFWSASAEDGARLWDFSTGSKVRELKPAGKGSSWVFRPDGKRAVSGVAGTNGAKLWQLAEGKEGAGIGGNRYGREAVLEKVRWGAFATNEWTFQQGALKAAETNHAGQVERLKKATDAQTAAQKLFQEKEKALQSARAAQVAAEKALVKLGPALVEATNSWAAAEKAALAAVDSAKISAEAKAFGTKLLAELKESLKSASEKTNATRKAFVDAEAAFKKAEQTNSTSRQEMDLSKISVEKAATSLTEAKAALAAAEALTRRAAEELRVARKVEGEMTASVAVAAFSADGAMLVTSSSDGLLQTWNADSGAALEVFHAGAAQTVVADDRVLAAATGNSVVVYPARSRWSLARTIGSGDARSVLADRVNAVRFSPDGQWLATGGGEPTRGGEIKLWDAVTGGLAREFKNVHSDTVLALEFSPDGKWLASGAADKFLRVEEVATGRLLKSFEGHLHHVMGVGWKQDQRTLASAGADNVIKVWDFASGERRKTVEGFSKEVTSVGFVGYGDQMLATSGDGQVRLLRDDGNGVRGFSGAGGFVYASASTPDGKVVAAGGEDGVLRVWNGLTGDLQFSLEPAAPGRDSVHLSKNLEGTRN